MDTAYPAHGVQTTPDVLDMEAAMNELQRLEIERTQSLINDDDAVPEGAYTVRDYADLAGVSVSIAQGALDRGIADGTLDCGMKRIASGHLTKHYWVKEE